MIMDIIIESSQIFVGLDGIVENCTLIEKDEYRNIVEQINT